MTETIDLRSTAFLDAACDALRQTSLQLGKQSDSAREIVGQAMARLETIGEARLNDLRDAQHALDVVDEENSDWHERDCCEEAFEAVGEFRKVAARIEEAGRLFIARSGSLSNRGHQLAIAAVARLEQKIEAIDEYLAIRPPDVGDIAGQRLVDAGSSSSSPAPLAIKAAPEANFDTSQGSLPLGFGWIDIDEVDPEGFIEDPAQFKKAKHDDMRRGLEILRDEIIPALKRGGFTREDAERTDQESGTVFTTEGWVHPDSRLTVWKAFLDPRREADVVAVERGVDGRYSVLSGRHRLGLARKLGIKMVPARILGRGDGT